MSTAEVPVESLLTRPKRADARRNYEKVLAAAREAFAEGGEATALEEISRSATELQGAEPWEALSSWFERFNGYMGTKRALAAELLNYLDQDAPLFQTSRASLFAAGEPLLERAQDAGVVRPDVNIADVIQMVVGISKIPTAEPGQTEHLVRVALDGLRYRPEG